MDPMAAQLGTPGRGFEAQVDALLNASRVLVALSVRTLGAVEPRLSPVQLRALALLSATTPDGSGGATMTELADALGVHPSNATRVCDRLVGLGLVSRRENPANRRMLWVQLSRQGHRLLETIMLARRQALAELLAALPESHRERLASDLDALVAAARTALPDRDLAPLGWTAPDDG
jgi:DNA-binding MarR family transcriptional regulator